MEMPDGMPTMILGADDPCAAATARYYATLRESMRGGVGEIAKARQFADQCDHWRARKAHPPEVAVPSDAELASEPAPLPEISVEPLAKDEPAWTPRKGRVIR